MNRLFRFLAGLLLGGMLGIGLVLLFAPRSGAELRDAIQERIDAILEEGREAAEVRRVELQTQFEALKQPKPFQGDGTP